MLEMICIIPAGVCWSGAERERWRGSELGNLLARFVSHRHQVKSMSPIAS